ncbi:hypothetical protein [Saccharothrix sp. NRRL B-16314]|uniref:hypothetical protein n=1 Tax=Saccharothrix sp. NRRL B-16314 TaxID=1463825 RepID=UPI000A510998|nr:hypothetical protein [Saccharothrix sp. NRRL B-16314]
MDSPADMTVAVTRSMQECTGRTLGEWVALVEGTSLDPVDRKAVWAWLRDVLRPMFACRSCGDGSSRRCGRWRRGSTWGCGSRPRRTAPG